VKTMVSMVRKIEVSTVNTIGKMAGQSVEWQRARSVPDAAIVSNFDPDQRQFLTDAVQGMVMVQDALTGRLAYHDGYGAVPPGQTQPLRPQPGQTTLLYPVSAAGPAMNTTLIRGGKVEPKRTYPVKLLTKAQVIYIFGDTSDVGLHIVYKPDETVVAADGTNSDWNENSPLPPGMRYIELQDMEWIVFTQFGLPLPGTRVSDSDEPDIFATIPSGVRPPDLYTIILPRDSQGNIRHNVKPLPPRAWSHLPEVYADYSYWTGEVRDPVSWVSQDPYWQERGFTKAGIETFLASHPAARFS
jgi:hypothetical protein